MGRLDLPDPIRDEDVHKPEMRRCTNSLCPDNIPDKDGQVQLHFHAAPASPRCGYTSRTGLWAPLTCDREAGHTGQHIHTERQLSIGFDEEGK